jgi:hypothetical protein
VLPKTETSADKRFELIQREFCCTIFEKILAMVISRNEGTFFVGRLITSLK